MTKHDKISSDVEATASSEQVAVPSQGRRRLVKGAMLTMPAVMTLRSGALAANSLTCLEKPRPITTQFVTTTPDELKRQSVNVYLSANGKERYYYDSIIGKYRDYDTGQTVDVNENTLKSDGSGFAVAYIDNNGNITALGPSQSGAPATTSCADLYFSR